MRGHPLKVWPISPAKSIAAAVSNHGTAESLNGKFRDEYPSLEWFRSRGKAKVIIETWRRHLNEVRPHYVHLRGSASRFRGQRGSSAAIDAVSISKRDASMPAPEPR
jgi:hypothetical protein